MNRHANAGIRTTAMAAVIVALAGCAQISVTANTLVEGTARIADATTNAVDATSDYTSRLAAGVDAQTHQARLAFVRSQMTILQREAAAGEGKHLAALAYMMQVENEARFARLVQQHYAELFQRTDNAKQMLTALYNVAGTPPDMQAG